MSNCPHPFLVLYFSVYLNGYSTSNSTISIQLRAFLPLQDLNQGINPSARFGFLIPTFRSFRLHLVAVLTLDDNKFCTFCTILSSTLGSRELWLTQ